MKIEKLLLMLFSGALPWPADTASPSLPRGHMHPKPALSISKDVLRQWTWQGTKGEGAKKESHCHSRVLNPNPKPSLNPKAKHFKMLLQ